MTQVIEVFNQTETIVCDLSKFWNFTKHVHIFSKFSKINCKNFPAYELGTSNGTLMHGSHCRFIFNVFKNKMNFCSRVTARRGDQETQKIKTKKFGNFLNFQLYIFGTIWSRNFDPQIRPTGRLKLTSSDCATLLALFAIELHVK